MSTRRYDPEATREDILRAAAKIFAERGFAPASTGQVAKAAGVSQSQIHYHFGSKEALWEETHRRVFKDYYDVQLQILTEPVPADRNRLEQSIEAYFRFFEAHPDFARMMMHNLLDGRGLGHEDGKHLSRVGAAVVAAEQKSGTLRDDIRPEFCVLAFLGLVSFWFMAKDAFVPQFGLEGDPSDYDRDFLDMIRKVLLRGMSPEPVEAECSGAVWPGVLEPGAEADPREDRPDPAAAPAGGHAAEGSGAAERVADGTRSEPAGSSDPGDAAADRTRPTPPSRRTDEASNLPDPSRDPSPDPSRDPREH